MVCLLTENGENDPIVLYDVEMSLSGWLLLKLKQLHSFISLCHVQDQQRGLHSVQRTFISTVIELFQSSPWGNLWTPQVGPQRGSSRGGPG